MPNGQSNGQPLIIDPTDLEEVHQALPCAPALNSWDTDDRNILVLHYEPHPAHEVPEYATQHHVLPIWSFNSQAKIEARLDDRSYDGMFGNGASGLIPANFNHWAVWDRDIILTVVFLHPKFVEQVASDLAKGGLVELIPKHNTEDIVLSQLGWLLKSDLEHGCPSGHLYRDSIATALAARIVSYHSVCSILRKPALQGLSAQRLQTVISYIHDFLEQDIRLVDLAALVGLSEYYFCRAFKQSVGVSLHQYIIQQRLEKAKQLLQYRHLTLAQIAQECGFSSHSHLTQQFERVFGISPKVMRSQGQDFDNLEAQESES
ncbi:helix-turn-helix transcriptional regulator [Leptolyngbya sp. AN02str]|uniref:helix-turn-helix transcriptional regulator n=1 Tax=Leptolyngbya sp. AN02str TaxID=3423363 RepID=UPI003D3220DA